MSRCHCSPIIHIGHQPKYLEEILVCGPHSLRCQASSVSKMKSLFLGGNSLVLSLSLSLSLSFCKHRHEFFSPHAHTLSYKHKFPLSRTQTFNPSIFLSHSLSLFQVTDLSSHKLLPIKYFEWFLNYIKWPLTMTSTFYPRYPFMVRSFVFFAQ